MSAFQSYTSLIFVFYFQGGENFCSWVDFSFLFEGSCIDSGRCRALIACDLI